MDWKDRYTKSIKPAYNDLLDFLRPDVRELFLAFDAEVNGRFNVHNKYHRHTPASGWVYGFGRSYGCELFSVTVNRDCFNVLKISVDDRVSMRKAINKIQAVYDGGFEERYAEICAKRRQNQTDRSRLRVERERAQMERITETVDPDRFNKFKWCRKVSRNELKRLYQSDAKGFIDEDLLEDVGFSFYMRCKQAKEVREHMENGRIVCHYCGAALSSDVIKVGNYTPFSKDNLPMVCDCGYSYTYREYRRSCNAANMPGGRAEPVFDEYMRKWQGCKEAAQKMMCVDWLIHECHMTLMSGLAGRSVCVNLIEGTKTQISDLINGLAYGE